MCDDPARGADARCPQLIMGLETRRAASMAERAAYVGVTLLGVGLVSYSVFFDQLHNVGLMVAGIGFILFKVHAEQAMATRDSRLRGRPVRHFHVRLVQAVPSRCNDVVWALRDTGRPGADDGHGDRQTEHDEADWSTGRTRTVPGETVTVT